MVSVEDAVISRLKKDESKFEILVDHTKVQEFRKGKKINIDEILAYPGVYHDVRRGNLIPSEELQKNFGTTDIYVIAKKIMLEGELQFTTEQRRKLVEEKTKEIADIISKRGINPQTNTPHPPQRILNAMKQAGVHVDPLLDANLQIEKIVKSIKPILPIRIESIIIEITIPAQHTGKTYSILKRSFEEFKEEWLNDGSLRITLDIPAGTEGEILQKIGNVTRGDFRSRILERVGSYGKE